MDIIFTVAVIDRKVSVDETLTMVCEDNKIHVPIVHDRVIGLQELQAMRKVLHERIDSIIDHAVDNFFEVAEKKEKKQKKEKKMGTKPIKVFNCFGKKPEMVEI